MKKFEKTNVWQILLSLAGKKNLKHYECNSNRLKK